MKTIRPILYLIFLFLFFIPSSAQSYDPKKINKKAVALYEQAMSRIEKENFASAAGTVDRKSTRLNSSHSAKSRMPSSA